MNYVPLETTFFDALNLSITPGVSLSGVIATLMALMFVGVSLAALYGFTMVGIYRIEPSEQRLSKSKEFFKKTVLGILGIFLMFLIVSFINEDILFSDVKLDALRNKGVVGKSSMVSSGSGGGPSCESKEGVISKITSSSGICAGTSCTILSGCSYTNYLPIIKQEAALLGVDYKTIVAIMCKESSGRVRAENRNDNGTYDCGLMQINQPSKCDESIFDPNENIKRGVRLFKEKTSLVRQSYPGFPERMGVLASYNCCANGTVPHSASGDCTTQSGFPFSIPKWACPINPGDGRFNMCSVKNYVCSIEACISQIP